MGGRRRGLVCTLVGSVALAALAAAPGGAQAATTCGSKDKSGEVTRGTLSLDGDQSSVTVTYKRSTSPRTLLLVYGVEGCRMPASLGCKATSRKGRVGGPTCPVIETLPKGDGSEIPEAAVALKSVRAEPQELSLRLSIDHEKLEPGTYNGLIEVRSRQAKQWTATTRTPVTLSRSVSSALGPILLGAAAGAVAMLWYFVQKAVANVRRKVALPWLGAAFLAAAAVGIISALTAWRTQDVWTVDENGWATAAAAFTGATTGAMAVLLGNIWEKEPAKGEAKVAIRSGRDTAGE